MRKGFSVALAFSLVLGLGLWMAPPVDAETLPLDPTQWRILSPWGGSATTEATAAGIRFYGSGNRQGTQALHSAKNDLRNTTLYLKWRAHGPAGKYAAWGVGLGYGNYNTTLGVMAYGAATAGWTWPRHGAGFTTHNAWEESQVIADDTWYYTRLDVSLSRQVTAVTATAGFDDRGGTLFYSHAYTLSQDEWERLAAGSLVVHFNDNYGGTGTWLEVASAEIVAKTDGLLLTVRPDGLDVNISWTPVPGATGYTLYYALPDYKGGIDPATVGWVDLGNIASLPPLTLFSGAFFHVALASRDKNGPTRFSALEKITAFGGQIVTPQTGDTLMEIRDEGGLGTATFVGTATPSGPTLPLQALHVIRGTQKFTVTFDENGQSRSYTSGDVELRFTPRPDGTFAYEYYEGGTLQYRSPATATPAQAAGLAVADTGWLRTAATGSIDCGQSREEFQSEVEKQFTKQREDIRALAYFCIAVTGQIANRPDADSFTHTAWLYEIYLARKHLDIAVAALDEMIAAELARYDADCTEDPEPPPCTPEKRLLRRTASGLRCDLHPRRRRLLRRRGRLVRPGRQVLLGRLHPSRRHLLRQRLVQSGRHLCPRVRPVHAGGRRELRQLQVLSCRKDLLQRGLYPLKDARCVSAASKFNLQ